MYCCIKKIFIPLLILTQYVAESFSQDNVRALFYNVENYFDCDDDSLKNDAEFLPGGIRGWTPSRFWKKTGNIARVLAFAGENGFPAIVGMAEIENDKCLDKLTKWSPLRNAGYSYIHYESPDVRGIDVCLLYNPFIFKPIYHRPYSIEFKNELNRKTRDVLYVCGEIYSGSQLHLFVCHLPSRLGGELETESNRCQVAATIRKAVDSIFLQIPDANILIMGDFNDTPVNKSIAEVLRAKAPVKEPESGQLYDMMLSLMNVAEVGTHKNQAEWALLDHMIVSGNLLKKAGPAMILKSDFLLMTDRRWLGMKPFRTYHGMKYQGGYSDHLPVYLDLIF